MSAPGSCASLLRRYGGPEAREFAVACRPDAGATTAAAQAEAVYRRLAAVLGTEKASFGDLVAETLFLRDVRRDLPPILDARTRVLSELGQGDRAPLPAFIGQAPVGAAVRLELAATGLVPRHRDAWSVRDVRADGPCACDGCARSAARVIGLGARTQFHSTNVYGAGTGAFEQAYAMFVEGERLLERCGFGFRDVVRTWIHLRDIDRDYDALNQARRAFFRDRGIAVRPASTGVQGAPFPAAHDFSLRMLAGRASGAPAPVAVSTPTLNEAWTYGADFSRGLRVADADKTTLFVSGTASIDEAGRTVHAGDFAKQASRMLRNVSTLLAQQGAGFDDVVSAVTYVKEADHAPALEEAFRAGGFEGFPRTVVEAPLCRPELLCETEAVAILPLAVPAR